ncbi:MAG: hypothetical protein IPO36_18775 [Anaerolineales bacterium]|nr:hypothetical protein [Anaerolineales bacterium]
MLIFGLWLVFRKIERIPPLSIERVVGSLILFFWLLTILHTFVATAETAEAVALKGIGGGYIGGKFQWVLWIGFGSGGAFTALVAWLGIGIAILLDKPVQELFFWLGPLFAWIRKLLKQAHRFKRTDTCSCFDRGIHPDRRFCHARSEARGG